MAGAFTGVSAGAATAAGCSYGGQPTTVTTLTVAKATIPFGATDKVSVSVYSGASAPTGDVKFKIDGTTVATATLVASDANTSVASWKLPTNLGASTHTVLAVYPGSCDFAKSTDSSDVTVVKASTVTAVAVVNSPVKVGRHPKVGIAVSSPASKTVKGKVKVILRSHGKVLQIKGARLIGGTTGVVFDTQDTAGTYKVVVKYLGSKNFLSSTGAVLFKVV